MGRGPEPRGGVCTHAPPGTLTLPTWSLKPCAHSVGTSSSWISILLPLKSESSYRQTLCSRLSCRAEEGGGGEDQERRTGGSRRRGRYHADGPQRHEAVAAVRVAPGVPARILPLLQDEHLAAEVGLLEGNEAGEGGRPGAGEERELEGAVPRRLWGSGPGGVHLRAALHHHGAHAVQAALDHVHDLADDLHHAALEVLLVEHHDLHTGSPAPVNRAESDKQNRDDTGRDSLCRTPCRARRSWWPCWRRREPEGSCPWSRRRTWWSETW